MKQFFQTAARQSYLRAAVTVLFIVCLLVPLAGFAQSDAARSVEGKVYGAQSVPQSSAVVYLQDSKTNNIKSFISTQDGSYRFGQLSPDVDYQLWAEYKGKKSDKKTISSFNSKKQLFIDLHLKD
ncbi:carboxypeptidase regulatory-like domain-containing protein [Alloacidobacterium dinghuense]|uniref:Carboxypeptidase regulatory-like domain-containing protein n=1 Tax=Alloacidobacterium dinghuense TaxID=2763107 RepID=A0A7G8BH89_9BACT|nr:carboxypeptidase-like regulatory domain-containing protein [Alloacidobacterium dinghuense]QNI31909.1 carboxypeptidase regulatory-like domain-containing protein [Alloacidobacterium dinghuense]